MKKDPKLQLRSCKICGKAFVGSADSAAKNICPDCVPKADKALDKVREYLRKNPRKTLNLRELADAIGETPKTVQALYEDESILRGEKKKPPKKEEPKEKNIGSRRKFSGRYRKGDSKE
jgi:ribosome-binding protein aMBF1 (putative translation factor)